MCNIKFELTLTRWPIHTGYGTMRVYRVILAELPNQFEEKKRNAFPIIDLAWRLSVTQHQTCLSSHIHSNVLYILFCTFISGAIVLSQVIRTIMHCNKIIPFFSVEFVSFITLTCNSFLETPSTSVQSMTGEKLVGKHKVESYVFWKSNSFFECEKDRYARLCEMRAKKNRRLTLKEVPRLTAHFTVLTEFGKFVRK